MALRLHTWTRVGALAFLAYFLLGAAWAVAMPFNGNADESEHIVRAYAVATGQVLARPAVLPDGHPGAYFDVPRSLAPDNPYCLYFRYENNYTRSRSERHGADCLNTPPADPTPVRTWSWVGRYHPAYYLVTGLPMRVLPDMRGIILGRLVNAAWCAVLFAGAVVVAWLARRPLMPVAVVLSATPSIVGMAGAINPTGVEVAAATALWPTLLVLCGAVPVVLDRRYRRWLAALAGVASAMLISVRGLGLVLFIAGVLAIVATCGWARVRAGLRHHVLLWTVAAAAVTATAWNLVSGNFQWYRTLHAVGHSHQDALRRQVLTRIDQWLAQIVGQFGWAETFPPNWMPLLWYSAAGLLIVPAALAADRRRRWVILGIPVVSLAMLIGFEHQYLRLLGYAQFGRYVLPLTVASLAVAAVSAYPAPRSVVRRLTKAVAVMAAGCHMFALPLVMTRFQHDPYTRIAPLTGTWLPASGPIVPLVLVSAGGGLLIVLGWAASRWTAQPARPAPSLALAPGSFMDQPPGPAGDRLPAR